MKSSHKKLVGITLLLVFLVPLSVAGKKVYREVRQPELNSALIAAVKKNDTAAVVSLLSEGADPNSRDVPPDNRSFWQKLWDGFQGKPLPTGDRTALLIDLEKNFADESLPENIPLVTALLNAGATVSVSDENGDTPLILAAGTKFKTVRLLLERGAQVNAKGYDDFTALFVAASESNAKVVQLLLAKGAHVNDRTISRRSTPLLIASLRGQVDIVRMIVASGGEVNMVDNDGNSPLSYATQSDNPACVKLLLEHGAHVGSNERGLYDPKPWDQKHAALIVKLLKEAALQQAKGRK